MVGRGPLPAACENANLGAHGLSRHNQAAAEVTRPTFNCFVVSVFIRD
jgi:hypothetical protein